MQKKNLFYLLLIFLILLNGCANGNDERYPSAYPDSKRYTTDDLLLINTPETLTILEKDILIDYSNASLGYLCIKRLDNKDVRMKVRIVNHDIELVSPRDFATYNLNKHGEYETFPIAYGNGSYTIIIFEYNPSKDSYMQILHPTIQILLNDSLSPYLYPNQVVDYNQNSTAIQMSFTLCEQDTNDLQRVKTLYDYVVKNIKYDDDKVKRTKNTYVLPIIDETLATKKGICFDYAALFAAMCRAQHIPCKVVVGNTTIAYHAWVEVWLDDTGWINPETLFASNEWTRADPTFTATGADYDDYYETIYEY